jgi:glucokinase
VRAASAVLPGWAGARVRARLEAATGLPVHVENDVRAMAAAEAVLGAGRGYRTVLHVSVGTGIGGAITRDGRLVHGARGTAGEIAHLLVPEDGSGRTCGCGRTGHLEAAAAGPGIEAEYARRTGRPTVALPQVVELMRAGDGFARAVVADGAALLGRALAGLVIALDADAVVLGGGVAAIGPEYRVPLAHALHAEVPYLDRHVPVVAAALGTDAPLLGAVLLASEGPANDRPANDRSASERPEAELQGLTHAGGRA